MVIRGASSLLTVSGLGALRFASQKGKALQVDILAATTLIPETLQRAYGYTASPVQPDNFKPTDPDALAEAAGRICYKSFNRPNPATASNDAYLANILRQGHFSVLEHASVTFLVRGVSRALLTELSRHRHLSFSVVSQRYVDYSETEPVIPPAIRDDPGLIKAFREDYAHAVDEYNAAVSLLTHKGLTRKQAREAARALLPNCAPVDMIVTGNLRAWRDVLAKRHSVHADAEIQEFARLVLAELRNVAPASVQDISEEAQP